MISTPRWCPISFPPGSDGCNFHHWWGGNGRARTTPWSLAAWEAHAGQRRGRGDGLVVLSGTGASRARCRPTPAGTVGGIRVPAGCRRARASPRGSIVHCRSASQSGGVQVLSMQLGVSDPRVDRWSVPNLSAAGARVSRGNPMTPRDFFARAGRCWPTPGEAELQG